MLLSWIDWLLIGLYLAFSLGVSVYYIKPASRSMQNFFVGNRRLPWGLAGLSMVATTFAADTPLAVTELVAQNGIAGNWLWWNALAGGMLTTFFFASYWRRSGVITDVELVEIRYSGRAAAFLRGFKALYMGVFMNVLIIAWVNVAMASILQVFFQIPTQETLLWVALLMAIVMLYTSLSGLIGVVITDAFQFVLAMLGSVVLAFLVLYSDKIGGVAGLKAQLPQGALRFLPTIQWDTNALNQTNSANPVFALTLPWASFLAFMGMQWWASWYPGAEPGGGGYVAQRLLSTKNEREAVYATLLFQVLHYCLRPWAWIMVGLCAIVLYPDLADKKMGYTLAMRDFLPEGLRGLLLVAFLAAYMSTLSTQLNWGASYLINDFYKRFLQPRASEKQLVFTSRIATILIACIALYVTSQINSIAKTWQFLIECGAGLGLVLILRWYWWRINAWSEIAATIAPFVALAFSKTYLLWDFPYSFFFTLSFTTIAWIMATWVSPPTAKAQLQQFYDQIQPAGFWQPYQKNTLTPQKRQLKHLFICWFSAMAMAYSLLFCIGKCIFAEWYEAVGLAIVFSLSLALLQKYARKLHLL